MEELLEVIRAACVADASPEVRAAGAQACRSILASLEPEPQPAVTQTAALPTDAIPQLVAMIRGLDMDQLLDLAIGRLRSLNAARPGPTLDDAPSTLRIPLVPIPAQHNKAG
jgi:hypothetical protein